MTPEEIVRYNRKRSRKRWKKGLSGRSAPIVALIATALIMAGSASFFFSGGSEDVKATAAVEYEIVYDTSYEYPPRTVPETAESKRTTVKAPSAARGAYAVQVGAFRSSKEADKELLRLKSAGFAGEIRPGTSGFRRVVAFAGDEKKTAERIAASLSAAGFKQPLVVYSGR